MIVKSLVLRSLSASRGNLSLLATASTPPWTPTPSHRGGFLAIHANFLLKDLRYNIHSNILQIDNNKQHRLLGSSFCEVYYSSDGTKDAKNEEIKNQEEVVKCPHCDSGFMSEEALSQHIDSAGKAGGGGCEVLWRERNEADVKAGKLKHVCDECGIGYEWKSALDRHKAVHREKDLSDLKEDWEEEGVICPHCDIGFANDEVLQTHLDSTGRGRGNAGCRALWKKWNEEDVKAGKLPHVCDHDGCGIGFRWKSLLDKHKAGHSDDRPYSCKECGKSYKLQGDLDKHVREKHSGQVFECPECEKPFNSKSDMKKHLKFCRQEEKEFKCSQCGLKFHTNSNLTRHIKAVHSQERPHKCELCDYSFSTKGKLKQHMRAVHENARPHQCEDCDAAFSTTGALNIHRITHHTFDWPHTCHVCEERGIKKGYIRPGELKKHMEAQHPVEYQEQLEREKPAVCPQCGKRFKNENQVKIHVKKMHN